jgi:hypothetical protein
MQLVVGAQAGCRPAYGAGLTRRRSIVRTEELYHLSGLRVALEPGFLENGHAVTQHLEAPRARRHEVDVGVGKRSLDLSRQTDGSRFIVSKRAEFDRDAHEHC